MSYLSRLEAESIHVMREVVAECSSPVMLYSIGKDSSVMLHLARKAFLPGPIPFPLMHIDTGWKFREMIAFRDAMAREHGFKLIVHRNSEGERAGIAEQLLEQLPRLPHRPAVFRPGPRRGGAGRQPDRGA